jgi:hypothetical protein
MARGRKDWRRIVLPAKVHSSVQGLSRRRRRRRRRRRKRVIVYRHVYVYSSAVYFSL